MSDKTENLTHFCRCHDRCWSLGRVEYLKDFQISQASKKKSLKLPMGKKKKPGCEAGVVAMTTRSRGDVNEGRHLEAELCRALKKRPDIRKKGGAGCW